MFETAAAGVLEFAPDVAPLTWETFIDPVGWWKIPDDDCVSYKAELTLRGGQESRPHSHPWRVD